VRRAGDAAGRLLALPLVIACRLRLLAFSTVSNGLSLMPGRLGRVVRRGWYESTLEHCGRGLVVDFGAAIRTRRTRVGNDCYIGLWNWIGWADLGDDFMSGSHVSILSGHRQHHHSRTDIPMREQSGELVCVWIGPDVWVGANATISGDVAAHTIVGSGAVVTRKFDDYAILGGVPARPIGDRREAAPPTEVA
jgi:virginiamycin A acetyltransferase